MSISEFKPALRDAIVKRLTRRFRAYTLEDLEKLELDVIRKKTNKKEEGYEAVLTRANLQELSSQFDNTSKFKNNSEFKKVSKIAESVSDLEELAKAASTVLSNANLFDNFIKYLIGRDIKESEFESRKTGNLRYLEISEDIKLGKLNPGSISDRDILIFKENHGDLAKVFREFLGSNTSGISVEEKVLDFIKEQLDAGHLVGVFNIRFKKFFNLRNTPVNGRPVTITELTEVRTNNQELSVLLSSLNNLLIQSDYLSSNTVLDPDVFITAEKRVYGESPEITVELQLSVINQEVGRKLSAISRQMNEIIDAVRGKSAKARTRIDGPGAKLAVDKLMKSMVRLSDDLKERAIFLQKSIDLAKNPKVAQEINNTLSNIGVINTLLGTKGSPSIKQAIEVQLISAIAGVPTPREIVSTISLKEVGKSKVPTTTSKKTTRNIGNTSNKYSPKVRSVPVLKDIPQTLTALETLLNANLVEQVKQNMGSGNSRDILNLRSGRFAESVKVERLSESRAGMITVFYSYMKNPYATFSAGGRQSSPTSRDPKLLIARSIREIAQTQVANRLRSVSV